MNKYILLLVLALCTVEVKAASEPALYICKGDAQCAAAFDLYVYKVLIPKAGLYVDCESSAVYRKERSVDCADATILLSEVGKHGREAEKYFGVKDDKPRM